MRKILLFYWLIIYQDFSFAQPPLEWDISAQQLTDSTYTLVIQASLENGWHVYAGKGSARAPGSVKIHWSKDTVRALSGLLSFNNPVVIDDKISNHPEKVWKGNLLFKQTISVDKPVPPTIRITLSLFAANDTAIHHLKISRDVKLPGSAVHPGVQQVIPLSVLYSRKSRNRSYTFSG